VDSVTTARVDLVKRFGNGDLVILRFRDGFQAAHETFWTRAKARKPTTCVVTDRPIAKGDEVFRPFGNVAYRMVRIRAEIVDRA
jgi:hypothetical protein